MTAAIGWQCLPRPAIRQVRQRARELASGSDRERKPAFHEVIGQTRLQGHQTSVASFGSCGVAGSGLSSGRHTDARAAMHIDPVGSTMHSTIRTRRTQWCQGVSFEPPVRPRTYSAVRLRLPTASGPSRCPALPSSRAPRGTGWQSRSLRPQLVCRHSERPPVENSLTLGSVLACNPRNAFAAIPASLFRAARMTGKGAKGASVAWLILYTKW